MFRHAAPIFSVLSLAMVVPAGAQTQSPPSRSTMPSNIGRDSARTPVASVSQYNYKFARDWGGEATSYRTALRLASCIGRFDKELAHSAALADAASQNGARMLQRASMRNRGCVSPGTLMSPIVLRAAFFETAMKEGVLPRSRLGIFLDADRELAISQCQLQKSPGAVKEVFSTLPESAEEEAAITRLLGGTRDCGSVVVEQGGATVWRLALLEAAARGG